MHNYKEITYEQTFSKKITVDAPASRVWNVLTNPDLMKKWMLDEEINIVTDWKIGGPIIIQGNMHWVYFENKGTVLQFETERLLQYSHLSSLSELPDKAENYSLLEFKLTPLENQTILILNLENFPTESIYKHVVFYWTVTLELLKKFIENNHN